MTESRAVLARLLSKPENRFCFDCEAHHPTWASTYFGVFLCIDCAGLHRNLGTHLSFVRSTDMDSWTREQLWRMTAGGNGRARSFFKTHQAPTGGSLSQKYSSRAAYLYRELLSREAAQVRLACGDTFPSGTTSSAELSLEASAPPGAATVEKAPEQEPFEDEDIVASASMKTGGEEHHLASTGTASAHILATREDRSAANSSQLSSTTATISTLDSEADTALSEQDQRRKQAGPPPSLPADRSRWSSKASRRTGTSALGARRLGTVTAAEGPKHAVAPNTLSLSACAPTNAETASPYSVQETASPKHMTEMHVPQHTSPPMQGPFIQEPSRLHTESGACEDPKGMTGSVTGSIRVSGTDQPVQVLKESESLSLPAITSTTTTDWRERLRHAKAVSSADVRGQSDRMIVGQYADHSSIDFFATSGRGPGLDWASSVHPQGRSLHSPKTPTLETVGSVVRNVSQRVSSAVSEFFEDIDRSA
jgi:hypothetical protein